PIWFARASCLSPETPARRSVYGDRVLGAPTVGAGETSRQNRREMRQVAPRRRRSRTDFELGLRSRLGDFGHGRFAGALRLLRGEMVLGQSFFQELETFFRRIAHLEQVQVWR